MVCINYRALRRVLLVSALLLFTESQGQSLVNREVPVFGCFNQFYGDKASDLGYAISNLRCQQECRVLGYPLSSTSDCTRCFCGLRFPEAAKTNETECSFSCEPQCATHSRPLQASCGGPSTHIVSGTGNIDMNKEILRNMGQGWREKKAIRNDFIKRASESKLSPPVGHRVMMRNAERNKCLAYPGNWWIGPHDCTPAYEDQYWKIEQVHGYYSPYYKIKNSYRHHCLQADVGKSSAVVASCGETDKQHWTFTRSNTYEGWFVMYDKYKLFMWTEGEGRIGLLDGPEYQDQIWKFEGHEGTTWLEDPEVSVTVKQATGVIQKCTARTQDNSPSLDTYVCKETSTKDNLVTLQAVQMEVVDATPLSPSPPELLGRMICDNKHSSSLLLCKRSMEVTYSVSSGYTATTTVNTETTVSSSLEMVVRAGIPVFNTKTTTSLASVIRNENAFTSSEHRTETETITHTYEAVVPVGPGKEIAINIFREKQDVTFAWKAKFSALGPFELKFINGYKESNAVSKLQDDDYLFAFGMYTYPDVDVIRAKTTGNDQVILRKLD